MGKIRIGIIGTGFTVGVARSHIRAYQANEDAELVAFYDLVPERSEKYIADNKLQGVTVCKSLDEFFSKVDALSICVPNNQHFAVARAALDAGKHFICEKPLSNTYETAKQFADYVQGHANKVISMIGFNYRDIPAVRYFKKIIDEGKIGKVYSIVQQLGGSRIANPNDVKREWRMDKEQSGSGALPDFGSHLLDLEDYLLSEGSGKLRKIHAYKSTFIAERHAVDGNGMLPVTNDDAAVFSGVTEKGTLCSFYVCRIGMPFETMQITGEGGMLYYSAQDGKKIGIQLKDKNSGYASPFEYKEIPAEFFGREGHKGLIKDFTDSIKSGTPNSRNIDRGLYIQRLLDKVAEAAETGKEVSL